MARKRRKNKLLKSKKGDKKRKMAEWEQKTSPANIPPKVYIGFEAKNKLDLYIACAEGEISGIGKVEKINGKFLITEVILLPQECSASSSDLDEKALDEFVLSEVESGRSVENLKLWWHSHASMGAFWSGTDTGTIEKFRNGWFISIVGNKSGEYKIRLDLFEPFRYVFDELHLETVFPPALELKAEVEAEIAEKVKVRKWTQTWNTTCRKYDCATKKWTETKQVWDSDKRQWVEVEKELSVDDLKSDTHGEDEYPWCGYFV